MVLSGDTIYLLNDVLAHMGRVGCMYVERGGALLLVMWSCDLTEGDNIMEGEELMETTISTPWVGSERDYTYEEVTGGHLGVRALSDGLFLVAGAGVQHYA